MIIFRFWAGYFLPSHCAVTENKLKRAENFRLFFPDVRDFDAESNPHQPDTSAEQEKNEVFRKTRAPKE